MLLPLLFCFVAVGCTRPASPRPVVYAFTASWCGPCQQDKPRFQSLGRSGAARVIEIDYDRWREKADRWGVDSLPYYFVFKGGKLHYSGNSLNEVIRNL